MLGGIIAIDMGGYQTAAALAQNAAVGRYAGILSAATLGCTVCFVIPLGAGMLKEEDKTAFFKGISIGLGVMPIALAAGRCCRRNGNFYAACSNTADNTLLRFADAGIAAVSARNG